ncbi:MAG: hypothetical protein ACK44D_03475 [Bacteroidia bacterium]
MGIFFWILLEIAVRATYYTGGFNTIIELPALQDNPYNFNTTQISDNHIKLALEKQYNYQTKGYDVINKSEFDQSGNLISYTDYISYPSPYTFVMTYNKSGLQTSREVSLGKKVLSIITFNYHNDTQLAAVNYRLKNDYGDSVNYTKVFLYNDKGVISQEYTLAANVPNYLPIGENLNYIYTDNGKLREVKAFDGSLKNKVKKRYLCDCDSFHAKTPYNSSLEIICDTLMMKDDGGRIEHKRTRVNTTPTFSVYKMFDEHGNLIYYDAKNNKGRSTYTQSFIHKNLLETYTILDKNKVYLKRVYEYNNQKLPIKSTKYDHKNNKLGHRIFEYEFYP